MVCFSSWIVKWLVIFLVIRDFIGSEPWFSEITLREMITLLCGVFFSDFFLLRAAHRTRSGRIMGSWLRKFLSKSTIFSWKVKCRFYLPMNRKRTYLFSVKRDHDSTSPPYVPFRICLEGGEGVDCVMWACPKSVCVGSFLGLSRGEERVTSLRTSAWETTV